jgi:hypothetical protein
MTAALPLVIRERAGEESRDASLRSGFVKKSSKELGKTKEYRDSSLRFRMTRIDFFADSQGDKY